MLQDDLHSCRGEVASSAASSMGDQLHHILFIHPVGCIGGAVGKFIFALGKNERLAAGCVGVIEQEAKEVEKPKPEWYGDKEQSMYGRVSENCGKGKHGGV